MGTGGAWKRTGPIQREGDARSLHIGSVNTVAPSISTRTVECPSHVTRRSEAAFVARRSAASVTMGTGHVGARSSFPRNHSLSAQNQREGAMSDVGSGFTKQ